MRAGWWFDKRKSNAPADVDTSTRGDPASHKRKPTAMGKSGPKPRGSFQVSASQVNPLFNPSSRKTLIDLASHQQLLHASVNIFLFCLTATPGDIGLEASAFPSAGSMFVDVHIAILPGTVPAAVIGHDGHAHCLKTTNPRNARHQSEAAQEVDTYGQ
ncbi:hypothetical protein FZEAL_9887 [Fusarium zealandicum]|uniref:Uncharacterized protein n=1 Tax=Fusarium zealandicum TaxID=1053134 RepID=A0A8H4U7Z9_9HYPO|nr:hypothetical protein FZEAL_9887 [Fusarium zealandicum]